MQKNQKVTENKDGGYTIETDFGNGQMGTSIYDRNGNFLGGGSGRKV